MKIKTKRYYLYNLACLSGFFIAIMPVKLGLFLAKFAGKVMFTLVGKARQVVFENLKSAFPEKGSDEISDIAKGVFVNICKTGVELINMYKLDINNLDLWVKVDGAEKVDRALAKKKGVIMLASHFGNWELIAPYFGFRKYYNAVIARRLYFNKYNDFIEKLRRSKGVGIIYRDESPKKFLRLLRDNGMLGILADQDVDSIDGVFVDFFGKPAYTPKAPVALAMASGAEILPCFMVREGNRHRLIIEDSMTIEEKPTKEETIKFNTQKWSNILESYIGKYPDHWVWMHKRWKTKPESKAPINKNV